LLPTDTLPGGCWLHFPPLTIPRIPSVWNIPLVRMTPGDQGRRIQRVVSSAMLPPVLP
jgi:hypothetical protein